MSKIKIKENESYWKKNRNRNKYFNNSVIIDSRHSKFRNYQILSNNNKISKNNNYIKNSNINYLSRNNSVLYKNRSNTVLINNYNYNGYSNNKMYLKNSHESSSIKAKTINRLNLEIQNAIKKTTYLCSASNINYKNNRNINLYNKSMKHQVNNKMYENNQSSILYGNNFEESKFSVNKNKKRRSSMEHISANSSFSTFCNSVIYVKK